MIEARPVFRTGHAFGLARDFELLTGARIVDDPRWHEAIHERDRQRVLAEIEAAPRFGRLRVEFRLRLANGTFANVRASAHLRVTPICGREEWRGRIYEIEADHSHICAGRLCYCPDSDPHYTLPTGTA